jgi:hypothetical protein
MWIRILLVVGLLPSFVLFARSRSAYFRAFRTVLIALFILISLASILFPEIWQDFALFLGVGRGSDLLLYLTVVVFIFSLAITVRKIRDLERKITLLVQKDAIEKPRRSR